MKLSILRLAILVFAFSVVTVLGEQPEEMMLHCYTFYPEIGPTVRKSDEGVAELVVENRKDEDAKSFLEKIGVTFPPGSFFKYEPSSCTVCMRNTETNHAILKAWLNDKGSTPTSIELDASFIAFDLPDIETAARKNLSAAPTTPQIAELWKSGKGHLLGTHKVTTRSGVNAQSQGVDEQIYASEFDANVQTNAPEKKTPPAPRSFETREVGMIFNITPTVGPDGHTMDLVLAPEFSDGDVWDAITTTVSSGKNNEENLTVRQPRFHSSRITTTIAIDDGATFIQGGMTSRDGQSLVYLFLTARIIGTDGKPVHPDAMPKVQGTPPKAK